MSLPVVFLEELRARTPMLALVGRLVRLTRAGREHKGCCPFHSEKTPSFHVYDDHFHCFGCGAHGDAISYVMQSQGLTFLDAVGQLAREAGLSVPSDPAAVATRAHQARIGGVLDAAQAVFVRGLREAGGAAAASYLQARGITPATAAEFGLGWSGARGELAAALDWPVSALVEAGLMTRREEDGVAVDFFRDRLMFPISDVAGRVVSFGGRTLGTGQPKYLNGPETPIFAKRRTLYGLDRARDALADGARLIVVEGYLDVMALHQAGYRGAVAPLGSALTAEQLEELWRLSPSPVLCFDGDAAGRRAALHAMETALPRLAPDRTLQVVSLPEGEDPDSFIRTAGPAGMREALRQPKPMQRALYEALRPEGKGPGVYAEWRNRLAVCADMIADHQVCERYWHDLLNFYFDEIESGFVNGNVDLRMRLSGRAR